MVTVSAGDGSPSTDKVDAAERQIAELSKRIEFYITEYSVEYLADKMHRGDYVVPQYQREFTWEPERRSRFLESMILGLPIPFIFFWEMADGRLEIVDGSQRLRTIEDFLLGDFQLSELDQLFRISGFRFRDLPESRQRKIRNRSIRGIVLNEHADEAARFDMFERINTGSKAANKAEIRRGALTGPFLTLVTKLAEDPAFARLTPMSKERVDLREREELVTRFFAYGDGLGDYHDRPADFLFDYSKKMNSKFVDDPSLAEVYQERLHKVLGFVERVFPHGFSRTRDGRATPRARFEAIAIGSARALQDKPELVEMSPTEINVAEWLGGQDFKAITGADGANAIARLRGRIEFVRDKLVVP